MHSLVKVNGFYGIFSNETTQHNTLDRMSKGKDDDYEFASDSDKDGTSRVTSSALANKHGFGGLITKREMEFDLEELGRMNLKDSFISEFLINKGVIEASGYKRPYFVQDLPVSVEIIDSTKKRGGKRRKPHTTELIDSIKTTKNMTLQDIGLRRQAMIDKMKEYGHSAGDDVVNFIANQEEILETMSPEKRKESSVSFCRFLEYAQLYFSHYIYENILVEGKKALVKRNKKEVSDKKKYLKEQMSLIKAQESVDEEEVERHFSPKKRVRENEYVDVRPSSSGVVASSSSGALPVAKKQKKNKEKNKVNTSVPTVADALQNLIGQWNNNTNEGDKHADEDGDKHSEGEHPELKNQDSDALKDTFMDYGTEEEE